MREKMVQNNSICATGRSVQLVPQIDVNSISQLLAALAPQLHGSRWTSNQHKSTENSHVLALCVDAAGHAFVLKRHLNMAQQLSRTPSLWTLLGPTRSSRILHVLWHLLEIPVRDPCRRPKGPVECTTGCARCPLTFVGGGWLKNPPFQLNMWVHILRTRTPELPVHCPRCSKIQF